MIKKKTGLYKQTQFMKKSLLKSVLIGFILFLFPLSADATTYYFYVQLKDKHNSPYTLANPSSYLSTRAIARRAYYSIPVDSTDLPVNPAYISQIANLGIHVHCKTKWLNGVTLLMADTTIMSQVRALPFVKFVQYTGLTNDNLTAGSPQKISNQTNFNYGVAATQINQMNGSVLHNNSFRGENIYISVIDDGFQNVNLNPAFDSLRMENRLLGTKDFVNPASDIYDQDSHGAKVLSCMAANIPGKYLGTAPKASYLLIRTENAIGEYLCEADFWTSGIEYADSTGVDVSTSSLGYTTFNDSKMNFTYSDLNGKTARASIAADMAVKKGIVLLNSAGNEGDKTFKYISVPSDAEGVITVGSVSSTGVVSGFSSFGPTSDGRVKPELCAMGSSSTLVAYSDSIIVIQGSGTSYSCPILAGLTACYLQAAKAKMPSHTLSILKNNLIESGSLYSSPTNQMGYGIPDFSKAYNAINKTNIENTYNNINVKISINSQEKILKIGILDNNVNLSDANLIIYSVSGQVSLKEPLRSRYSDIDIASLGKGIYVLSIQNNGTKFREKILIR